MPGHLMNTYARQPLALTHGEGCWVWGSDGRRYLDALSGIAVNTVGHAHPRLVAALRDQVGRLIHTSNVYEIPLQDQLADRLCELTGAARAFFCNSGLEANEAAIKLARLWGHQRGIDRPALLVFEESFHGRSLATLSATGNAKVQKGFEPLVEGFVRLPLNDAAALRDAAAAHPEVAAVLIEPVQGEGGIRSVDPEFLRQLRRVCDARGWLLMFDEVQSGMGRTGKWLAHQWADVRPDAVTLAKGLGSGVPIGALLAWGEAATTFGPGQHGSTFGGNPLACRAALETLAIIEDEGLLDNARRIGAWMMAQLRSRLGALRAVVDVRGAGLMLGIELDRPCTELVAQARELGLLINVTHERVVRLLPPLILRQEEAEQLLSQLVPLLQRFVA
jgi:acetylornithine aminotransferase